MKTREQVNLALIKDNPWQPRSEIDQDELQKLADSIYQLGLLQAPLGRRHPEVSGQVQLAFGHQRVAALRLLLQQGRGEMYVEMDVAGISDEGMAVLALTENERRKQLSQIEVVRAHYRAVNETELTVQALADQLGIDRSTLSNNLRVLGSARLCAGARGERRPRPHRGPGVSGPAEPRPRPRRGYAARGPRHRRHLRA